MSAARVASNLSELYLTVGNVTSALDYAQQSVVQADKSDFVNYRVTFRTTLADVLHQAGHIQKAEKAFHEAEEMLKAYHPEYLWLRSLWGFRYCDLLLSQEKYQEVKFRASGSIVISTQKRIHLDIAFDHLSLGRSHLFQARQEGSRDFTQAAEHLNQAVYEFRQARTYLPPHSSRLAGPGRAVQSAR